MKLKSLVIVFVIGMLTFMSCSQANAASTKKQTTEVYFSQATIAPVILASENTQVLQTFKVLKSNQLFELIVCLKLEQPVLLTDNYVVSNTAKTNLYIAGLKHNLYLRNDYNKNWLCVKNLKNNSIKIRADSSNLKA
jgi:hypothetical protein